MTSVVHKMSCHQLLNMPEYQQSDVDLVTFRTTSLSKPKKKKQEKVFTSGCPPGEYSDMPRVATNHQRKSVGRRGESRTLLGHLFVFVIYYVLHWQHSYVFSATRDIMIASHCQWSTPKGDE